MTRTRIIQEIKAVRQRRLNGETPYPKITPTNDMAEQIYHSFCLLKKKKSLQYILMYFEYGEHAHHNTQGFGRKRYMFRSIYKIFRYDLEIILHLQNIGNNDLRALTIQDWKKIRQETAFDDDDLEDPRVFTMNQNREQFEVHPHINQSTNPTTDSF